MSADLCDKSVSLRTHELLLKSVVGRKIRREYKTCYVGVAASVNGHSSTPILAISTEIARVDERASGGVEYRDKSILYPASVRVLKGILKLGNL